MTGSGPNNGLSPSDIKDAYALGSLGVTGTGQTLGLFELDGYTATDITTAYATEFSLTAPTLQNVYVDSVSGSPGSGADEVTLDIEVMVALASGVSKIMVYEGPNTDQVSSILIAGSRMTIWPRRSALHGAQPRMTWISRPWLPRIRSSSRWRLRVSPSLRPG